MKPLSKHAVTELRGIAAAPVPRESVRPKSLANRLLRESLVTEAMLPSPFPTQKGWKIAHLKITGAGERALARALSRGLL